MRLHRVTRLVLAGAAVLLSPMAWASETLVVDQAVSMALQNNPRLVELSQRVRAAQMKPSQAMALADPMVSLNLQNLPTDTFNRSQEAMTQLQLSVSQKLPWPGKRALRGDVANTTIQIRRHELEAARINLIRDVRKAWWQLYFTDRSLDALGDNQTQLRQWVKVAQSRYRVGEGQQQDVLQAQVELSGLLVSEMALKGKRRAAAARLNALMDRDNLAPVVLSEVKAPMPGDLPGFDQLLQQALAAQPLLAVRQSAIDTARSKLSQAQKERYPDFTLRAAYGLRDGNNPNGTSRADLFSVGVSVNLPVFAASKQDKAVEQRRYELQARRYALSDSQRQVREQLEISLADYQQSREQAELISNGIIPQTHQTLESMRVGYRVNKVVFANLIRIQIQLNNYRISYWRAITDARMAEAEIEAIIGQER